MRQLVCLQTTLPSQILINLRHTLHREFNLDLKNLQSRLLPIQLRLVFISNILIQRLLLFNCLSQVSTNRFSKISEEVERAHAVTTMVHTDYAIVI